VRGKGTKLGEGKGSKLGEPYPKVRLSQDRLAIEPSFTLSLSLSGLLCINVVRTIVASRKCHSTKMIACYNGKMLFGKKMSE
jgi:hypothetical protein